MGNATAFEGQLKGLGFDAYEIVSLADLDITTADLRRRGVSRGDATGRGRASAAGLTPRA